jgi:hypothetical protein
MSNPSPVMSKKFIAQQFTKKHPDDPLSDKAIAIRFKRSTDERLRQIPEYSGLVRDVVERHFSELDNATTGETMSGCAADTGKDKPLSVGDIYAWYGERATSPKSVFLPQRVLDALGDRDRLNDLGFDSAHHFMAWAITEAARVRGIL